MPNDSQPKSPNETLAESIVKSLQEKGLIQPEDAANVLKGLCSGSAKVADWNRWVENKLDRKDKGAKP